MQTHTLSISHTHTQCGPCRSFTPQFVKTYNKLKEAGKPFEVIFVSSDRDEESMFEYLGSMPWYAVPFGDSRKKALSRMFDVSGERVRAEGRERKRRRRERGKDRSRGEEGKGEGGRHLSN